MHLLATVSLSVFALLVVIAVGALVGGSTALQRAMDTVARDTRSAALASELEAAVLMHQRLSNLHVVTREPPLDLARRTLAAQIRGMLPRAAELVGAEAEQRILDDVGVNLERYLAIRQQAEDRQLQLAAIVQAARPALGEVLDDLRALRDMNDAQVQAARAKAVQLDRLAIWVGASAGGLLILGFAIIAWGTRRYLLRPVLALHGAMARFRQGDLDVQVATGGVQEVDELARMFGDMAASLAQQRRAQLTFLAGVAHDLKSPLSTLKTGLYVLEHEPSDVRRASTRASLDHQVDMLNRMVDDLLDATRIEAGQLELRRQIFDLRRLVSNVVDVYVPLAPDHQITAEVPEQPVLVDADGLRIEQVIRNLVSNAVKFSPYGGPVTLVVTVERARAVLSVSDRGIGMTADELDTIFLPFRRRKLGAAPGTGLGLSVVRRIVSAHDGHIDVASEPGAGSTFRVSLPLADQEAALPPA